MGKDLSALRGLTCILLVLAVLLTTTRASADLALAKEAYKAGSLAYQEGRYDDAVRDFLRSYEEAPRPALLFNIAQAHRAAGHDKDAVEFYERYYPTITDTPEKAQIALIITELRQKIPREPAKAPVVVVAPPPPPPPPPAPPPPKRRLWPILLGVAAGVVVIGAVATGAAVGASRNAGPTDPVTPVVRF